MQCAYCEGKINDFLLFLFFSGWLFLIFALYTYGICVRDVTSGKLTEGDQTINQCWSH